MPEITQKLKKKIMKKKQQRHQHETKNRKNTLQDRHLDAEKGHGDLRWGFKGSSFWAGGAPQSTLINQSTST